MKLHQPIRFALVGVFATVIHIAAGAFWIYTGMHPLVANAVAFATAFLISFSGHYFYSFAGHGNSVSAAITRFLSVALLGFCVNETLLWTLLKFTSLSDTLALAVSTASVALLTFFLSRTWAFRQVK